MAGNILTSIDVSYPTSNESGAREDMIPDGLKILLSTTSKAEDCFVNQRFSGKLQVFLVGYNSGVYSDYGVYI